MAAHVWMSKSLLRMDENIFCSLTLCGLPGLVCEESVPEAEDIGKRKLLQPKKSNLSLRHQSTLFIINPYVTLVYLQSALFVIPL